MTSCEVCVDLISRGIDEKQAAELRARYATFAEDWDSPEMGVYDNCLETGSQIAK